MNILKQKELYTDRLFNGDIEARGLLNVVKTMDDVWCLVLKDAESKRRFVFHDYPEYDNAKVVEEGTTYVIPPRDGSLTDGVRFMYLGGHHGSKFAIHNLQTYDRPLIERIWPKCLLPEEAYVDTFIQSKVQLFDRPIRKGARSPHGLQNYAKMSGDTHKPKVSDFSVMNAYMLHRCIQDVDIQEFCTKYLMKEADLLKNNIGVDFTDALIMDNQYTRTCYEQEEYGAAVDIEHMNKCIATWDIRCHLLEAEIEPLLPPTVKTQSAKIGRKEMISLMGYDSSGIVDKTQQVKRNGETITDIIKPYYKPNINFHITQRVNQYSGFNISYGESPTYIKKANLTKWIKDNYPDTKPKDWCIEKEVLETKLLNKNTCEYFDVKQEDIDIICGPHTRVKFQPSKLTQHEQVKGFLIKSGIKKVQEWNLKKDDNGIVKAECNMTIHYPPKASYENQLHLDIKKGEALVTSPKIGEKDYPQLKDETGQKVAEYNTTMHRRRFIANPKDDTKGILNSVREDGRIPCGVNPSSTGTLRSSHRNFVNCPGAGALYGEEMRRCIIAPEGRSLVSADQNSAQLSLAAYYANNYEYFKAVAEGNEFKIDADGNEMMHPDTGKPWFLGQSGHCVNARAFTLISDEEWKRAVATQDQDLIHDLGLRRKKSKAGSFSTIFGASGKKVAQTLDIPEELGAQKRNAFLENIGLDRVISICERMVEKNHRGRGGYIELPFGYFAYCAQSHKLFNYLDQGSESCCEKWAELYFDRESKRLGLDAHKIMTYHK